MEVDTTLAAIEHSSLLSLVDEEKSEEQQMVPAQLFGLDSPALAGNGLPAETKWGNWHTPPVLDVGVGSGPLYWGATPVRPRRHGIRGMAQMKERSEGATCPAASHSWGGSAAGSEEWPRGGSPKILGWPGWETKPHHHSTMRICPAPWVRRLDAIQCPDWEPCPPGSSSSGRDPGSRPWSG